MTGFDVSHLRVGLAGAHSSMAKRAPCDLSAGDLYVSPAEGANVTSSSDVTFKWDTSCLTSTTEVDLYLYTTSRGLLHSFPGVDFAKGEYNAGTLDPKWWNYTAKASVYLSIVDANTPRFLSSIPIGPTFQLLTAADQLSTTIVQGGSTAVVAASAAIASSKAAAQATATASSGNGTAAGAASDDPGMFSSAIAPPGGLSKAVIAVAVVVPVVIVALIVGLYVKFARIREREKRKRWSEHVDRRMSVISGDWRQGGATGSVYSAQGGSGGARPMSMARSSMVSTGAAGAGRPVSAWTKGSSVYAVENNVAGRGAMGFRGQGGEPSQQQGRPSSQLRPASIFTVSNADLAMLPAGGRSSHISFADAPNARQSRVSFGDALIRPSKSSLSINVVPRQHGESDDPRRMSRAEPSPTAGRHSIDGAHAMVGHVTRGDPMTVSPSQASGPFAVPAVPARTGFFSAITSAVGKRDKKSSASAATEAKPPAEDWAQAEATRRSADRMRDMEDLTIRRSVAISQYSARSSVHAQQQQQQQQQQDRQGAVSPSVYEDPVEELAANQSPVAPPVTVTAGGQGSTVRSPSPMGMMGMPLAGAANPDQLLAAYAAARAAAKSPTAGLGQAIDEQPANPVVLAEPAPAAGMSQAHARVFDEDAAERK
ncbi:hypothetical protein NliqN6_4338 [Naganishia liquefaciens]|uniref:Uncharacterized protein n=1 Tax=Naganishia liquefaciens TaxID=104408 RepID=A0A8H3TVY5_9TREE|nr:hypothetical protein NliqN6_4338 [Naganishia liquefaciens]